MEYQLVLQSPTLYYDVPVVCTTEYHCVLQNTDSVLQKINFVLRSTNCVLQHFKNREHSGVKMNPAALRGEETTNGAELDCEPTSEIIENQRNAKDILQF